MLYLLEEDRLKRIYYFFVYGIVIFLVLSVAIIQISPPIDLRDKGRQGQEREESINKLPENNHGLPEQKATRSEVNPKYIAEDSTLPEDLSNRIVVKLNAGVEPEQIAKMVNAEIIRKGPLQFATLALPGNQIKTLTDQLKKSPGVCSVNPVHRLKISMGNIPSTVAPGTLTSKQWGLDKINVPKAWDLGADGSGITVAVIDTGVDLTHPDLKNNILSGYNAMTATEGNTVAKDRNGHGTHVAGIIAAEMNDKGINGIAYQSKILPVKALSKIGEGTDDCLADGIVWAADHGARIINLSIGSPSEGDVLKEAIQYAADKGCLLVAAAGNEEDDTKRTSIGYPAADPHVLAVTAIDEDDQIASFSVTGSQAELTAPGVDIISTFWNDGSSVYAMASGTSMAAPFVSGIAALVWSVHPELSARQVRVILDNSACDLGLSARDSEYGFGRVDGNWAMQFADKPKTYSSPANIDWSGGTVQTKINNTQTTLSIPPRAFGLDPDFLSSVSSEKIQDIPDLPEGIQPYGDPVNITWDGHTHRPIELTLTELSAKVSPDSDRLGYLYRWSGSRWLAIGGGENSASITVGIAEPGIYRMGYALAFKDQRIAGKDRIQTSIKISQVQFPDGTDTVILARADNFPDALAGVPLAYRTHAPILLTSSKTLPHEIEMEIQRLAPQNIILLGGEGAISATIEQTLKNSYTVSRLGGSNRFATAAQIASTLGTIGQAVIVNGNNFPDALSISSVVAQQGTPVLLTNKDSIPPETQMILQQLSVSEATVVGGESVVSSQSLDNVANPERLAGNDRYGTAAVVLNTFQPRGNILVLATGDNFPDALTGGVLAAYNESNLLLIPKSGPTQPEKSALDPLQGYRTWTLGGEGIVPEAAVQKVIQLTQ